MKENAKQNISIKIGDLKRMSMTIDPGDEELIREAESYVNKVLDGLKRMFVDESPKEQMARTAFQFAKIYLAQYHLLQNQAADLQSFEDELDRLLEITAQGADPEKK